MCSVQVRFRESGPLLWPLAESRQCRGLGAQSRAREGSVPAAAWLPCLPGPASPARGRRAGPPLHPRVVRFGGGALPPVSGPLTWRGPLSLSSTPVGTGPPRVCCPAQLHPWSWAPGAPTRPDITVMSSGCCLAGSSPAWTPGGRGLSFLFVLRAGRGQSVYTSPCYFLDLLLMAKLYLSLTGHFFPFCHKLT